MADLPSFPRSRQSKQRGSFVCYSSLRDLRGLCRLLCLLQVGVLVMLLVVLL